MTKDYDICIIGAGIAGASLACMLAGRRRVLLLERESRPGYHSTGRSAATMHRSYGNAAVRVLTAASASCYLDPPPDFSEVPLSRPRGVLMVAAKGQEAVLAAELAASRRFVPEAERLEPDRCLELFPLLRAARIVGGMYDPSMIDLDVDAILEGYLRGARRGGVELRGDADLRAISFTGDGWCLELADATVGCDILVNAAGAWADAIGELAGVGGLGIVPMRRTAITVPAPAGMVVAGWPMVADVGETWYVKPEAGRLLCSPADETPCEPSDAQPDELDVAICVDRVETALDLPIRRIEGRWAGLRSFAADRTPVNGFDPRAAGFFWLAGQGGYGIQTAPAMAALAAAAIVGEPAPEGIGVPAAALSPARLLQA